MFGRSVYQLGAAFEKSSKPKRAPKKSAAPMTSREMVHALRAVMSEVVPGQMWKVENGEEGILPGIADSVRLSWASVPKGSPEIDALNAPKSIMLAIDAPSWHQARIRPDQIGVLPVDKVTVRTFNGRSQREFRGKTGTPEQVIAHVAKFMLAQAKGTANKTGRNRAGSSRTMQTVRVVTYHKISNPNGPDLVGVGSIPAGAFADRKTLVAALRKARLLPRGERIRSMRTEGANKVVLFPSGSAQHSYVLTIT